MATESRKYPKNCFLGQFNTFFRTPRYPRTVHREDDCVRSQQAMSSTNPTPKKEKPQPALSAHLPSGEIIELLFDRDEATTTFAVSQGESWKVVNSFEGKSQRLVPYAAKNNLVRHGVVLFPSEPEEYGSVEEMFEEIKAFIHRYVDLTPVFESIAASYVLLSWTYDRFNELPYLRLRGDPGSGKTRALLTIGSICYKPIFASGASTASPIFRLLDSVKGTLILDESDFRFSDEKAEIIKILNNGNAKGFPVLRSDVVNKQEFDPRAYHVFGPKVIATRSYFQDHALETRCLTEEMGMRRMRTDIPLNLPETFSDESRTLRNKLLRYRFRNLGELDRDNPSILADGNVLEPRMRQLLAPLLAVTPTAAARDEIRRFAKGFQHELLTDRSMSMEAQLVEVLLAVSNANPEKTTVKKLTASFEERFGDDYERKITARWIGSILRRRFGLKTYKTNGVFVIPEKELSKLTHLAEKYGVNERESVQNQALLDAFTTQLPHEQQP